MRRASIESGQNLRWRRAMAGGRTAALIAGALVFCQAYAAQAAEVVQAPACRTAGQHFVVDLSTTTTTGVDSHWTVNNGNAYHTSHSAWTALPNNYIQPGGGSDGSGSSSAERTAPGAAVPITRGSAFPIGDYEYKVQFFLPCDPKQYKELFIKVAYAADNWVTSFSVGSFVATAAQLCTPADHICFQPRTSPTVPVTFTVPGANLSQGLNTMTVRVKNWEDQSPTGLAVQASLYGICNGPCIECPKSYPNEWMSKEFGATYCCKGKPGGSEFCCIRKKGPPYEQDGR